MTRMVDLRIKVDEQDKELLTEWRTSVGTTQDGNQYVRVHVGKNILGTLHQFIMGIPVNRNMCIDHINGDGLDNRRSNLRFVTATQNQANSLKRKIGKSKYKGVSFKKDKKKWVAYICPGGKYIHLGYFTEEKEAARAYNKAARKEYGEYCNLNDV